MYTYIYIRFTYKYVHVYTRARAQMFTAEVEDVSPGLTSVFFFFFFNFRYNNKHAPAARQTHTGYAAAHGAFERYRPCCRVVVVTRVHVYLVSVGCQGSPSSASRVVCARHAESRDGHGKSGENVMENPARKNMSLRTDASRERCRRTEKRARAGAVETIIVKK